MRLPPCCVTIAYQGKCPYRSGSRGYPAKTSLGCERASTVYMYVLFLIALAAFTPPSYHAQTRIASILPCLLCVTNFPMYIVYLQSSVVFCSTFSGFESAPSRSVYCT